MNWSAALVALVPTDVVTLTSTTPALPGGLMAEQVDVLLQFTLVAGLEPNAIVVPPPAVLKLVPVIVTFVPPAVGPLEGLTPLTVGQVAPEHMIGAT